MMMQPGSSICPTSPVTDWPDCFQLLSTRKTVMMKTGRITASRPFVKAPSYPRMKRKRIMSRPVSNPAVAGMNRAANSLNPKA